MKFNQRVVDVTARLFDELWLLSNGLPLPKPTMKDWAKRVDKAKGGYLVVTDAERRQYYELLDGFTSPVIPYDDFVRFGRDRIRGIGGVITCRGVTLVLQSELDRLTENPK